MPSLYSSLWRVEKRLAIRSSSIDFNSCFIYEPFFAKAMKGILHSDERRLVEMIRKNWKQLVEELKRWNLVLVCNRVGALGAYIVSLIGRQTDHHQLIDMLQLRSCLWVTSLLIPER